MIPILIRCRPLTSASLLLLAQLVFTACTEQELQDLIHYDGSAIANPPAIAQFAPGASQYGEGTLTRSEALEIQYLQWPQTYEAMTGSYGFPFHRTETADYYKVEGTEQWIEVEYNGRTAIGYSLLDALPLP